MVGPDIREIYETKLRDWHLQKDPNFRWCAHVSIYMYISYNFRALYTGNQLWKNTLVDICNNALSTMKQEI